MTTLNSTGLDVSEVPFPSVVICSEGMDLISSYAGMLKMEMDEIRDKNFTLSPLQLATLMYQSVMVNLICICLINAFFSNILLVDYSRAKKSLRSITKVL